MSHSLAAFGAALIATLLGGSVCAADTIGIAACDEFLSKYEVCLSQKVPAAQQAAFKTQVDQTRKTWIDLAKDPVTKSVLEASCRQTAERIKASLQPLGCAF